MELRSLFVFPFWCIIRTQPLTMKIQGQEASEPLTCCEGDVEYVVITQLLGASTDSDFYLALRRHTPLPFEHMVSHLRAQSCFPPLFGGLICQPAAEYPFDEKEEVVTWMAACLPFLNFILISSRLSCPSSFRFPFLSPLERTNSISRAFSLPACSPSPLDFYRPS